MQEESTIKDIEGRVRLTFLGGFNEIGGNCILLEDFGLDITLLIDFGVNFKRFHEVFDREEPSTLEELLTARLIPRPRGEALKNLYTEHYLYNHEKMKRHQKVNQCKDKIDPSTAINGAFISHAHRDHYYCLPLLNRNIPIYTGAVTHKIIIANYDSRAFRMDNFYNGLKWKLFITGDVVSIKGMEVIPVHVDHSIPAAYGFIFKTSAGILIYSGDFRMHGPLSYMTGDLISKARRLLNAQSSQGNDASASKSVPRVKALICEGTHIHKGAIESEAMVKTQLNTLFKKMPFDYVLVKYERVDWDRFRTFSTIAKKFKWKYLISEKDAYFYYRLNKNARYATMKNPHIKKDDHIYIVKDKMRKFPWKDTINAMLEKNNKTWRYLDHDQLKDLGGKFILYITSMPDYIFNNLPKDLNGVFISSNIDPYVENFRDNTRSIEKRLLKLRVPSYRVHASGHAKPHDIYTYVMELNPELLIPIHTEHPEIFDKLFTGKGINVALSSSDNEPFQVDLE